ncbi:MAG TPA: SAM-dependent methyltransferase [Thiolinea sp.]|nr:SAM-dependent methyltransferase [Thiolinea sp.]
MHTPDRLPQPDPEALSHSQALSTRIQARIRQQGPIPFHDFMHMALYEPGLGYYVAGRPKLGPGGDFTTAPEISALFSRCLAQQCADILAGLAGASLLEFGAGRGVMAAELLQALDGLQQLPQQYLILEPSPHLQQVQHETLQQQAPAHLQRVQWLTRLPQGFRGVMLANEVLDAMPVALFDIMHGQLRQVQVGLQPDPASRLARQHDPSRQHKPEPVPETLCRTSSPDWRGTHRFPDGIPDYLHTLAATLPADLPYCSEFNPLLPGWLSSVAGSLDQGSLLLIDYGYERAEYYHPERHTGTLLCHYRQRVHDNPLLWPGLQDITASVDFTAVAEAGTAAGLVLAGYTTQAQFLINTGLEQQFLHALATDTHPQQQYALAQQVRLLTLPQEMGERFRVMAFNKGFTAPLQGFRLGDRMHRL